MPSLCQIQNLNLTFGVKTIFKDVSLSINKGDKIGLIGLNGKGKSTLFKVLTQDIKPDKSTPEFIYDRNNQLFSLMHITQNLPSYDLNASEYYLAFYPKLQEVHNKLKKIEGQISQGEITDSILNKQQNLLDEVESLKGWDIQSSYESYLKRFQVPIDLPVHKMSGGEQRKIALSVGLSSPHELILWDEPTNHLDLESIKIFEQELINSSKTFILITHDRYLLNDTCNFILHLNNSQLRKFNGKFSQFLEFIEEEEKERLKTLQKLSNTHARELAWTRQGIKARGTRSKKRVERFENLENQIAQIKEGARKKVQMGLMHSGRKSKCLIQSELVSIGHNDNELIHEFAFKIFKGDKIAILGQNGAGKSSLVKALAGQLAPLKGEIKRADGLSVTIFDQKREKIDPKLTPKEYIGEKKDFIQTPKGEVHIHSYLERFLFTSDQINRPIETMSGGERNRLQLAKFMQRPADLWVFDEPTNDLDLETIEVLEQNLIEYDHALILISHDRAFIDNVANKSWLIHNKAIEEFVGGYEQVEPYLTLIEAQKSLLKEKKLKVTKPNSNKISQKDVISLEQIEKEIEAVENEIGKLDSKLAQIDYNDQRYQETVDQKSHMDDQLQNLMSQWEKLSERIQ